MVFLLRIEENSRSFLLFPNATAKPKIGKGAGTFTFAPTQDPGHPA